MKILSQLVLIIFLSTHAQAMSVPDYTNINHSDYEQWVSAKTRITRFVNSSVVNPIPVNVPIASVDTYRPITDGTLRNFFEIYQQILDMPEGNLSDQIGMAKILGRLITDGLPPEIVGKLVVVKRSIDVWLAGGEKPVPVRKLEYIPTNYLIYSNSSLLNRAVLSFVDALDSELEKSENDDFKIGLLAHTQNIQYPLKMREKLCGNNEWSHFYRMSQSTILERLLEIDTNSSLQQFFASYAKSVRALPSSQSGLHFYVIHLFTQKVTAARTRILADVDKIVHDFKLEDPVKKEVLYTIRSLKSEYLKQLGCNSIYL